jgi:hypothetical protein
MRHPLLAAAVLSALAAAGAPAHAESELRCDIHSDYGLTLSDRSLILIREQGTPQRLVMRQGRLFVDDRWVALTPEDGERLARFEREARQVVPLAQEVGLEAAGIALDALGEVAVGFSRTPAQTRRDFAQVRDKVEARVRSSFQGGKFTEVDIDEEIGGLVAELLPQVIGDVVAGAVQAALTGHEPALRSLDGLDQRVEALVEPKARKLRPKAEQLCERVEALDTLDNALAYRLPDGRALDLLQVERKPKDAKTE